MTHWLTDYLGEDWRALDHDCWAFFRRVQRERFGIEVPAIDPASYHPRTLMRTYASHPERARWQPVEQPAEGDGVLMGKGRQPTHVGVWVAADGGGVLHCQEGDGVIFTGRAALARIGWHVLGIYRHQGGAA